MKVKPADLPSNPSPEKWKQWKKCFEDGLRVIGPTEDADIKNFLRTFVGSDYFTLLESSENIGLAVSEAHKSALCPSSIAQCQSKGRRVHRTIFWKVETSC